MSYEGYAQVICSNGHYYCSEDSWNIKMCPLCKAEAAWYNDVNETNCDSYGEIPAELLKKFIVKPAVVEICNLGHTHERSPDIYRIPSQSETDPLQHYRPNYGGTPLVPLNKLNK